MADTSDAISMISSVVYVYHRYDNIKNKDVCSPLIDAGLPYCAHFLRSLGYVFLANGLTQIVIPFDCTYYLCRVVVASTQKLVSLVGSSFLHR